MIIGIDCSRAFGKVRTGTENYSYHLIKEMLRLPTARSHHFVLYTRPKAIIPEWIGDSQAEVVEVSYHYLWTQIGLARETWKRKLDVLWVPAHTLPVLRKPGLRTVVTIHGLEYQWLPEYKNWLQRWYLPLSTYYAAKYASQIIAVSEFTKRQLIELGTKPEKIEVIYEGVDSSGSANQSNSESERVLAKFGLEKQKYILFVGTVQPRKNLVSLIEAYAQVKELYPDIKLVVAGAKGWMTEEIYRAPLKYGVQDSVVFTGRVSEGELQALYSGATLYVQPSLQEGFGLPVLEAMKAGIPVVVSSGGALPEVVGKAGLVVPLMNGKFTDKLTAVICSLIANVSERKRLVSAGRKRVTEFRWKKAAQETLKQLLSSLSYKT